MKLDTTPYKGVRDFYPDDEFIQRYMFDVMRGVVESFGYVGYNASILESADLYRAKTGEEIVNEQTYTFTDRGEREVTLRPEMTPTVARMIAAKRRELSFPLRWYSIPNLFRYERPQRGRLREHWQLNVDLFGLSGIEADMEIISIASRILREFGLKEKDFEIRINSRKLVKKAFEKMGLSTDQAHALEKLIDKKDKINTFDQEAEKIVGGPFELSIQPDEEITELMERLENLGITTVFTPTLMRGFDYYTGIVFEVFDKHPENNRSLFGGGRYDELLDIFGIDPIPAVGFGMGDVTIRDTLETYGLLPDYLSSCDLYLCVLSPEYYDKAFKLAEKLREADINVAIDFTDRKVGDQIKKADQDSIPFVICLGEKENETGTYMLKELESGKEYEVKEEELASTLKKESLS